MSAPRVRRPPSRPAAARTQQLCAVTGARLREERLRHRWSLHQTAARTGLSVTRIHGIESGAPGSLDAYVRLATAMGLRIDVSLLDPAGRVAQVRLVDPVHSAMGEVEAAHLGLLGFAVGLDEPYQHYQFAGRADVIAWDLETRALLHIENRTRNPDFQAAAGAYNAKRAYLGKVLAERFKVPGWRSETHVVAGLWSAEMLHAVRMRPESFRALCPDRPTGFYAWWSGQPPTSGQTSQLVMLDPFAATRQSDAIDLEEAMTARPRYRDYAAAAARVETSTGT